MKASWRTFILGIATILGAIASAATAQFDTDPNTVLNIPLTLSALAAGWGLIVARDDKVTSEEAGAKPEKP